MKRFTLPRNTFFEKGSLEYLKEIKGKKASIVVGGGSMKRFGFLDKIVSYLEEAGLEVDIIDGVEPDPSVETVLAGAKKMEAFGPDVIVAVGGGSPIDAAKAMWVFYEHPDKTFDDIKDPFTIPELRNKAIFVAIPSTSGTATEVTAFSVITDYSKGIKYPLADYNITPDIAIVDPDLAQTMPAKLVAHTGMDALTHAIEAYVATLHSPFTNPLALEAIVMIKENLLKSFNGDTDAREQMHYAQCMAGMAFSNALLGITHSMAHKSGAIFHEGGIEANEVFHIPHGCANAIYLPYVIDFNKKACMDRYATIAKRLELLGNTDEELVDSLTGMIKEMNVSMNIPATIKEFGVNEDEFKAKVQMISERAVLDACTGSNPRTISNEEMQKVYEATFYGTKVDF
ncbi:iron-containing alcohol dehydrogenase [uncultured Clostridium sp.]|uniref:iron-containing alcohol dehydrogenase n=1 Tax=uncultured Clostridium sp. TaxID=59620 RepID=UPI00262D099C|nr:iron-containing alcohol dehydrogenase [uncultured Clostridium sp.]